MSRWVGVASFPAFPTPKFLSFAVWKICNLKSFLITCSMKNRVFHSASDKNLEVGKAGNEARVSEQN